MLYPIKAIGSCSLRVSCSRYVNDAMTASRNRKRDMVLLTISVATVGLSTVTILLIILGSIDTDTNKLITNYLDYFISIVFGYIIGHGIAHLRWKTRNSDDI